MGEEEEEDNGEGDRRLLREADRGTTASPLSRASEGEGDDDRLKGCPEGASEGGGEGSDDAFACSTSGMETRRARAGGAEGEREGEEEEEATAAEAAEAVGATGEVAGAVAWLAVAVAGEVEAVAVPRSPMASLR